VIAKGGIKRLLSGTWNQKDKKKCRITKQTIGAGRAESAIGPQEIFSQVTVLPRLGDTKVSRLDRNIPALWSMNRETHATLRSKSLGDKPKGLVMGVFIANDSFVIRIFTAGIS